MKALEEANIDLPNLAFTKRKDTIQNLLQNHKKDKTIN